MVEGEKSAAFVTFENDISAFEAISHSHHENKNEISKKCKYEFIVRPAHTSEQPQQQNSSTDILNDDCWEKNFQHLDVDSLKNLREVCKKFGGENGLVVKHGFKYVKELKFNNKKNKTSLVQMQRQLKYIGKYINRLYFHWNLNEVDNIHQFFELLARGIGQQLRYVYFEYMKLEERDIAVIKPILQNLTTLKFFEVNWEFDIYFKELCPNLMKLEVDWTLKRLNENWPTLTSLAFNSSKVDSNEFCSFIQKNPQITSLRLDSVCGMLNRLADHLKIIPKFSLRELKIELDGNQERADLAIIANILSCLGQFKSLCELEFGLVFYNCNTKTLRPAINTLAQELPNLKKITLFGLSLTKSNVIKFIHNALNLKEMYVYDVGFSLELLDGIAEAEKKRSGRTIIVG